MKPASVYAVLVLAAISVDAAAEEAQLHFIACPVYRDTDAGRKSGCWLADDPGSGVRYDVSLGPTKPDWNRAVLVEGVVAKTQDGACGGVTLEPVRVSVLDAPCVRHMLPAEGFGGRRFVLPARNVRPLSEPRAQPQAPFANRTFHVPFDFGSSFIVYQLSDFLLDEAAAYAQAVKPRRVVVTGFAATRPVIVSGRELAERPELARTRAGVVAEWLRRSSIPADRIDVHWRADPPAADIAGADGLIEPSRRRVDVEVIVE